MRVADPVFDVSKIDIGQGSFVVTLTLFPTIRVCVPLTLRIVDLVWLVVLLLRDTSKV